eukprot:764916-Hanusia_phi.AAC.3
MSMLNDGDDEYVESGWWKKRSHSLLGVTSREEIVEGHITYVEESKGPQVLQAVLRLLEREMPRCRGSSQRGKGQEGGRGREGSSLLTSILSQKDHPVGQTLRGTGLHPDSFHPHPTSASSGSDFSKWLE